MTTAFAYRRRDEVGAFQPVAVGETIVFQERCEYVLSFPQTCDGPLAQRLMELGGDLINSTIGVIAFGNFVGRTEFAGVSIEVISSKIGPDGVSRLLEDISELAASLVFGWKSPITFAADTHTSAHQPVPYHQLQFLRRAMLRAPIGQRLQDWVATIARSPTRRFEPERPMVPPNRVRRLDQRAVQSIFMRMDRLMPVPKGLPIANNALAQALQFGPEAQPHFPTGIAAPRSRLSFDTAENRFVKHVLEESLTLVFRFVDHPRLHATLRGDCRMMLGLLERALESTFLQEAGRLSSFRTPSQALVKADGYRDVFGFWNAISRHVSLPTSAVETMRLLEGRDMATLYEYWAFLKILDSVSTLLHAKSTPPKIQRSELGESLTIGLTSDIATNVSVHFNPTFTRTTGTAYSTPLRPDVIVEINGTRHAFDAKYRLDWLDISDLDTDDNVATYKRADLYKMHTYRDAIAKLQTAFIVYPGTEFVFYDRSGKKWIAPGGISKADGVGAIPLRPSDANVTTSLREVLRSLLTQPELKQIS